jgi:Putative adhesin
MASWTITEPRRLDIEDEVTRLDVSLIAGRLSVVGTDGPARVEISTASEFKLNVGVSDGLLSVYHDMPRSWPGVLQPVWWWLNGKRRFAADVSIAIPYQTPTRLRIGSGSVVASTVHADLTVDCASGRTTLLGVDGRLKATVVSGPIEALGCAGDIALETVSGEITVADTAAHRLSAKTISGALTADLDNPPHDSQINLETISGEITIRVREDSDLQVHLSAVHGRVTSAFPDIQVEGRWGTSVKGLIGAGTGKLFANAVGGNIALLCRPVDDDFGAEEPR